MPQVNPRTQTQQKPKSEKKSTNNNTTIGIIVAVAVLLGAGTIAFFSYPPFRDLFRKSPEEVVTRQDTTPKDTVIVEEAPPVEEAKPLEDVKPQKQEVSSSTSKGFYIIVGSFREQSNAERMVKKCKKDIELQVIYFQEIGMHRVSAGRYDNIRKAYNDTYSIKDLDGCANAWVLEVL